MLILVEWMNHYCLNFLFCVQWVKMRGDCLFCWYVWNWWGLLFKLSFFMFSELRWEVIVYFVDISGIEDHYCLIFLSGVQWVKMRGDCLFCWYWWNWWPLLCKLSFLFFSELRWEVIVCFVDIGGIDDHLLFKLYFLCSVS